MPVEWNRRSEQSQCLFNPAFSALMMCVAVRAYDEEAPGVSGLPFIASYLILPIALHSETRHGLPPTTRTSLTHWIAQHPEIHLGLADRVAAFRDITSEGIRYAVAGGIVRISDSGGLLHVPRKPRGLSEAKEASEEVNHCFKAATDLGRWFARVPDPVFLFRTLRIRP